jgi:nitrate reductase beta subunit
MATVYNWQIGREMSYWYKGARPERQFAAVFDLNKCIACQTCTLACKTTWTSGRGQEYMFWNNVETKPYGFYPLAWDVNLLELLGASEWSDGRFRGQTLFEAAPVGERVLGWRPDELDYAHPNIGEDEIYGTVDGGAEIVLPHDRWMHYLPRICNHCTYPACLASCPRGSIYKRPEDGIVLIDQVRCRGYQECVRGCPYKKTFFNPATGTSEKCIGCFPKIEAGEQPQCVTTCIGKIRLQSFLHVPEAAQADNPLDYLVHVRKLALPLYPQWGLEPNVYYIPPIHVPDAFLTQMFGPGVAEAKRTYRNAASDAELRGLLTLFGSTARTLHRFAVDGDETVGFDGDGAEVIRVPLVEPTAIRADEDTLFAAYRHNTP